MKFRFLLVLLLASRVVGLRAQAGVSARFSADNPTPLIGQPVHVVLTVEAPATAVVTFPEFPTEWDSFMVQSVGELTRTVNGDVATYRQTLTVILWRAGNFETPQTFVNYQLSPSGEILRIPAEPLLITVASVLQPGDIELRPLKPPASLLYLPPWLALVAAAGLYGAYRGWRWWRARQVVWTGQLRGANGPLALSPGQRALAELRSMRQKNLSPMAIPSSVSDCLRLYVQRAYQVQALEMTTGELLNALQAKLAQAEQRDLQRILDYADLVKFAHVEPGMRSARQLLDTAEKWVEALETHTDGSGVEA